MTKKALMLIICIVVASFVGCTTKEKDEDMNKEISSEVLINGNYYSEKDNSFIMIDGNHNDIIFATEERIREGISGEVFEYKIDEDILIVSNGTLKDTVIEIVDNHTLKLEDELFVFQRVESDAEIVNLGTYHSKTTSAYFWIVDNQTMKYVEEMASASIKYSYVIDGDRLIAVGPGKTKKFEIVDESSLKLDEDIFYLNTEE